MDLASYHCSTPHHLAFRISYCLGDGETFGQVLFAPKYACLTRRCDPLQRELRHRQARARIQITMQRKQLLFYL